MILHSLVLVPIEAYRGGKFACFSSANDKATTCDIYSGANSRIEWNGNVSGDNITIKFYKERQATLGYVLNGVEQLVTDEVGWESPTTKNLGNGVLTQLFAENNAGTSAGFFSVVVDGKVLVDPTNIYSVVSTDAANSKMTVDGGDWGNVDSPYDQRPDMRVKWSDATTASTGSITNQDKIFDGDVTTEGGADSLNTIFEVVIPSTNISAGGIGINCLVTSPELIVEIKNGGSTVETFSLEDLDGWGYSSTYAGEVTSIVFSRPGSYAQLRAISINGRILIDGPADNSQNWSDYLYSYKSGTTEVTSWYEAEGPLLAFNGDTSGRGSIAGPVANADAVFEPPTSIPFNNLKVYYYVGALTTGRALYVDTGAGYGSNVAVGDASRAAVYEINTPGNLVKIKGESTTTSNYIEIRGIEIDGKLLIDSGVQWDTSQNWSQVVTVDTTLTKRSLEVLFNGTDESPVGVNAPATKDSFTLDFTATNLTDVTKVEVGVYNPNSVDTYNGYSVNNGNYTDVTDGSTSAVIYSGASITLEKITVKTPNKTITDQQIHWIKINDKLLVDPNTFPVQNKVTGPLCQGTGDYVSHDGTTINLENVADRWCVDEQSVGLKAESDTEYTDLGPGASDVVWQSANGNPLTVPFSGDSCKLVSMVWELSSSTNNTTYTPVTGSPFTQSLNLDVGQDVPAWNGPPGGLADDTYYKAKVTYNSEQGVDPVTSDEITFKTNDGTVFADTAYFYDEDNHEVVGTNILIQRHGRDTANNELGIYDLTEQPDYPVAAHVKIGDKYKPIRDYSAEIAALVARIEDLENP